MCSACRLMVFNVCVKFHENMSSDFKVMERTPKLLTDTHTHTQKRRKHYTPIAYFVSRGYNKHFYVFFFSFSEYCMAISLIMPGKLGFNVSLRYRKDF